MLLHLLRGKRFSKLVPGSHFIFVSNTRIPCYLSSLGLLRVVTRCYLLLHPYRENVCQSTFKFPILYSFPTHEYLVACVHSACYVLLHVVTCCYIFRGQKFVKLFCRFPFYIRLKPTNTLLAMFIGLVTCCYALLPVVTSLEGKTFVKVLSRFPF